jgi:hypothetical protein
MADFSTSAMFEIEVDKSSLKSAKSEIEKGLSDPEVSTTASGAGAGRTGSMTSSITGGAIGSGLSSSMGDGFSMLAEFAEERNELLDDIKDAIEQSGGIGGGPMFGVGRGIGSMAIPGALIALAGGGATAGGQKIVNEGVAAVDERSGEIQDKRFELATDGDLGERIGSNILRVLDPTGLGQSLGESAYRELSSIGGELQSQLDSLNWPSLPSLTWPSKPNWFDSWSWPEPSALTSWSWPEPAALTSWSWPEPGNLLSWDWPSPSDLLSWDWPSFPDINIPDPQLKIPEPPQWVQRLLDWAGEEVQNATGSQNSQGASGSSGPVDPEAQRQLRNRDPGSGASGGGGKQTRRTGRLREGSSSSDSSNKSTTRRPRVNITNDVTVDGVSAKELDRALDQAKREAVQEATRQLNKQIRRLQR